MQSTPETTPTTQAAYSNALAQIDAFRALDDATVNPLSHTSLLTHGRSTERAILLLHGYTSSPRQFHILAGKFFEGGYNVLVPRFPGHGLLDRMTPALQDQTEKGLLAFTNRAVDVARGLGQQLTVLGFSMGGVLALWLAQHRADLALACAVSPALAFHAIPLRLTSVVIRYYLLAPNQFNWWNPETRDAPIPPLHAYPRFATRGLAQIANLGLKVRAASRRARPQSASVLVVTNPTDESVNNAYAHEIMANWRARGAANVHDYEFEARHNLKHDLMDPDQETQQIDVVYPILLDLVAR